MIRLILAATATVFVVAFALMNRHLVTISLVLGPPVQARLVLLLAAAFGLGLFSSALVKGMQRVKERVRRRRKRPADETEEILAS